MAPAESKSVARRQSPYSLLAGTSVMLRSILRYPPRSMIHGCSRYGGSSSAAVLGSKMGGRTSNAALPSFVGRSSLVIREYAFMRPFPSRGSFAFGWGVGLGELGRCDFPHIHARQSQNLTHWSVLSGGDPLPARAKGAVRVKNWPSRRFADAMSFRCYRTSLPPRLLLGPSLFGRGHGEVPKWVTSRARWAAALASRSRDGSYRLGHTAFGQFGLIRVAQPGVERCNDTGRSTASTVKGRGPDAARGGEHRASAPDDLNA